MLIEYVTSDAYIMRLEKVKMNGREVFHAAEILFGLARNNEFQITVSIESPYKERIILRDVSVSISKLKAIIDLLLTVDKSKTAGDFIAPLFSEVRALYQLARQ